MDTNGQKIHILKSIQHIPWNNEDVLLETFVDISERKEAEVALENSNRELSSTLEKVKNMQAQLIQSEKMASIGQLAAGVAHEINNPTGFITTNLITMTEYVDVFKKIFAQLEVLKMAVKEKNENKAISVAEGLDKIEEEEELSFIVDDSLLLLSESSDGARRIKEIVKGLRNFARQDSITLNEGNINNAIEDALKLTVNELKYNCKVLKELSNVPNISCH
jgi:two-component system NtrC family sensor kinase